MKLFKLFILGLLIHGSPSCSMAQINGSNGKASIEYTNNFVKNPSAELNDLYVIKSNATATRDTTAANRIDGKASWLINATALGDHVQFELLPESSEVTSGGNCAMKALFKGDGTMYAAKVVDSGGALIFQIPLTNETAWREVIVPVTCGQAALARGVRIEQVVAGTSPAINVGKVTWARYNATYIQPPNTFTAKVSATGVVTDQTPISWINGNAPFTGTTSLITYISGRFTSVPNCTMSINDGNGSGPLSDRIFNGTTSGISVQSNNNAGAATAYVISCTKTGADFSQPALTVQDMNFTGRVFTPNITYISGGGTNLVWTGTYDRNDKQVTYHLVGTFSAASAAFAGVRFNMPTGHTVDASSYPSGFGVGFPLGEVGVLDTGVAEYGKGSAIYQGTNLIAINMPAISVHTGTAFVLQPGISNTTPITYNAGDKIFATIRVNLAEWGAVTVPPVAGLVGTKNINNSITMVSAYINGTGTVTDETNGDFINGNCTNASPQVCTFNTNFWASKPLCMTFIDVSTAQSSCKSLETTSNTSIYCNSGATDNTTSSNKKIACFGVAN